MDIVSVRWECPKHGTVREPIRFSYTNNDGTDVPKREEHAFCPACFAEFLDTAVEAGAMKKLTKKITTN